MLSSTAAPFAAFAVAATLAAFLAGPARAAQPYEGQPYGEQPYGEQPYGQPYEPQPYAAPPPYPAQPYGPQQPPPSSSYPDGTGNVAVEGFNAGQLNQNYRGPWYQVPAYPPPPASGYVEPPPPQSGS